MILSASRRVGLALLLPLPLALTACQEAQAERERGEAVGSRTEVVAENYVEAYNDRDLGALAETLTDPIAYNGTEYDRATFLGFIEAYWESFAVLQLEPTHVVPAEEYVTLRVITSATGTGEYLDHGVDGREAQFSEMMLLRVRDGRASEMWSNWDELGFLAQLGIVERPDGS